MRARGYLCEVEFDGQTLTARGTTKAGQMALRGQQHAEGDVVLSRDQIARAQLVAPKWGGAMNGVLAVHDVDGAKYQLHFRKKSTAEFEALAAALGVEV